MVVLVVLWPMLVLSDNRNVLLASNCSGLMTYRGDWVETTGSDTREPPKLVLRVSLTVFFESNGAGADGLTWTGATEE